MEKKKKLEKENIERLERLSQTDKKTEVKEAEIAAEAFDIVNQWLEDPLEERQVAVTGDGGFLRYRPLTYGQWLETQNIEDENERRVRALTLMLQPCYPEINEEIIRSRNQSHIQLIQAAIAADDNRFLLPGLPRLYRSLMRRLTPRNFGSSATILKSPPESSEDSQ